jgi:hypothetical protein
MVSVAASAAAIVIAVAAADARASALTVSPAPGTPDASPRTQISILGTAPRAIAAVSVTGTVSGAHAGRLEPYSGGRGASFVLTRPLTQGERVSVLLRVADRAPIRFSFTVARLAPVPPVLDLPLTQPAKLDHFVSEPGLQAPLITVSRRSRRATARDILLTPLPTPEVHPESNNAITIHPVGPGGPMIVDSRGNLVWFDQLAPPAVAANLQVELFAGRSVLTWWQGDVTVSAYGIGEGVIADRSYRTLRIVRAGNGYHADLHEFVLAPPHDALLTVYSLVLVHLPGTAPGSLSPLMDSIVQEVDVRTGLVVWEWHALGHIPLQDSYATPATSADDDAFHINSLEPLPGGRVLVSARDTSAVYEVDRATGRIVWTLGGKASTFQLGPGARFWFQHDARLLPHDRISLFDDEAGPPFKAQASRGLILGLDLRRARARVVARFGPRGRGPLAESEGSLQTLPTGNVFVGFGSAGPMAEFSPEGALLFEARLPADDGSYREVSFPWTGTPRTRPALAVRRVSGSRVDLFASWNGATEVARWQALGRTAAGSLTRLGEARTRGFETRIAVPGRDGAFEVRALDAAGHVLASSAAVAG